MSLLLNRKTLTFVTTTRYLGVIIDQHLTWKAHVSYVLKKARYKLFALNRLKPLPDNLLCQLYQAFVLPVFDYCDAVWTPISVLLTKHLEHIHSDFFERYFSLLFLCQVNTSREATFSYCCAGV